MEELEAVKLDILEAGRKHGLREILLQSIAKLLEKGKSKEEICELLDVSEKDVDKAKSGRGCCSAVKKMEIKYCMQIWLL